jgi:hypothetical protein
MKKKSAKKGPRRSSCEIEVHEAELRLFSCDYCGVEVITPLCLVVFQGKVVRFKRTFCPKYYQTHFEALAAFN